MAMLFPSAGLCLAGIVAIIATIASMNWASRMAGGQKVVQSGYDGLAVQMTTAKHTIAPPENFLEAANLVQHVQNLMGSGMHQLSAIRKPSSQAGGIAHDLQLCADLHDVSEELALTIFKLDKYWSTVGDKEKKKCVTPCGANVPANAKDKAGQPISIETCCSSGNLLLNANLMLNPGYAGTEHANVNIGNLCSSGPAKQVSAAIKSVRGNVGVFRQLMRLNVKELAKQLGDSDRGALAHIAWFWNACCFEANVSTCWVFSTQYGDPVALKLKGAWEAFLGETFKGKLSAIESATADTSKLRTLASAWKKVDCQGDPVCINGLATDLVKIQDLKSMGGNLDLGDLKPAVVEMQKEEPRNDVQASNASEDGEPPPVSPKPGDDSKPKLANQKSSCTTSALSCAMSVLFGLRALRYIL